MKKTIALMLAAALLLGVFSLAGCKLSETEEDAAADIDRAAAVATIGDEVVTMGEYYDMFTMYAEYYSSMGYDVTSDATLLESMQDFIIDMLVSEKVVVYQAKQQGFDQLTEEQQAELDAQCEESETSLLEYYTEVAEEEYASDNTVDVEARVKELIAEEAEYYTGTAMSYDEYVEWLQNSTREDYYVELLQASVYDSIQVTDTEVQEWYDAQLAADTDTSTADPGAYKDDEETNEMSGVMPVLYVPEGFARVMDLFIAWTEEEQAIVTAAQASMTSLETEYGKLAFADGVNGNNANSARLKEIVAEYNTYQAKIDALYSGASESVSFTTISEAYSKIDEKGMFTVMGLYTEDADFTTYATFMENGMLISTQYESSIDWSDRIKEEFATLAPGEYTEIFADTDGLHVLYYVGDEPTGARTLDSVKDLALEALLADKQATEWDALMAEWSADESVVIDEELVRSVGLS